MYVLDSYVELRDDRRPVFAFFFAAWPELKARIFIKYPDILKIRGILNRGVSFRYLHDVLLNA